MIKIISLYNKGEIEMTGGSVIFWEILIFIGLVFDQRNSRKKERVKKVIAYK
ncbi:hypothetical protein bthur0013_39990 [Bacillus thuringiensis IBL 200]|uniref:Flagellar motor protein n=3 Tax=Bacillus cereus group TaxID=86661 RepID=A0ABD5I4H4_BACTU|nr:hypothetical protein bthur0013_39990 [Bacillus thuringiensis IBL 200]MDW9212169.1 Flagellar motor protein [Bacillus thuringiensis serovar toumanoffi]SEG65361.1 hypothetical protein SAMN04487919_11671 [Bacillus sp. ok061]